MNNKLLMSVRWYYFGRNSFKKTIYRFIKFSTADRVAIRRAAKAISPVWSSYHFKNEAGASLVSIGPLAAGSQAWDARDAFGLMALRGGRVELADFSPRGGHMIFASLAEALGAMAGIMSGRRLAGDDVQEEEAAAA